VDCICVGCISVFFVDIGGEFLLLFRRNAFVSEAFSA
jgi:hypothetical protein